jgi:hypothetical protein
VLADARLDRRLPDASRRRARRRRKLHRPLEHRRGFLVVARRSRRQLRGLRPLRRTTRRRPGSRLPALCSPPSLTPSRCRDGTTTRSAHKPTCSPSLTKQPTPTPREPIPPRAQLAAGSRSAHAPLPHTRTASASATQRTAQSKTSAPQNAATIGVTGQQRIQPSLQQSSRAPSRGSDPSTGSQPSRSEAPYRGR